MNSFIVKKDLAYLFLTQGKKTGIDREDLELVLDHRSNEKGKDLGCFDPAEEAYAAHRAAAKELFGSFACWE